MRRLNDRPCYGYGTWPIWERIPGDDPGERVTNVREGILVGIAGSCVGGALASVLGLNYQGFSGNLIVAVAGAVLLLWIFGRARQNGVKGRHGHRPGQGHQLTAWSTS